MEGRRDDPVTMQKAHIAAVRRLRAGAKEFPEARSGLEKLARFHIARAATLALELGGGRQASAEHETGLSAPAARLEIQTRRGAHMRS